MDLHLGDKSAKITLTHRFSRENFDEPQMRPIITIDITPSPIYINAHYSTHALTALLHNDQLILVEVQGSVEFNLADEKTVSEIKLGDVSWDETTSRAYLHIGHHRMIGRLQSLKTPLAVLVDKPGIGSSGEDKEWQVHTIIRKKLVFDIRPEPVFPDEPSL